MKKTIILLVSISILVSACSSYKFQENNQDNMISSETPNSNMMTEETGMMSESSMKEFTIHGSSFEFDKLELKVKKGDKVRITFISDDIGHNLFIDEFNVRTNVVSSGSSETVEFVADKEGTFDIYCNVGQHRQLGMESKLIVEP